MKRHLFIVETLNKKKSLKKILGDNYDVVQIDVRLEECAESPENVLADETGTWGNSFHIENLASIRNKLEQYDRIFISTDPGETGEALALQIKRELGQDTGFARVALQKITQDAVSCSLQNPAVFDRHLAAAFAARQTIDHVFDEAISSFLAARAGIGLSGGLAGFAALKVLSDRDRQIQEFEPKHKKIISLKLQRRQKKALTAQLVKINGQAPDVPDDHYFKALIFDLKSQEFRVRQIDKNTDYEASPMPFKTSTLLIDALQILGFSFVKTLRIAQQLYSGVKLSEKTFSGLITFYLTDSDVIRNSLTEIRELVLEDFGKDYLPNLSSDNQTKDNKKVKSGAIQPIYIRKTPKKIKRFLTDEQFELYSLIWKRTIASQMVHAAHEHTVVQVGGGENDRYQLEARMRSTITRGFRQVYSPEPENGENSRFPGIPSELRVGEVLTFQDAAASVEKDRTPGCLSEAELIERVDKAGLREVQYFSDVLSGLAKQKLINSKSGCLALTRLGRDVGNIFREQMPQLFRVSFVSTIEREIENLKRGVIDFQTCVTNFYKPFQAALKEPVVVAGRPRSSGIGEPEVLEEKCEKCGRNLIVRVGKYGRFVACTGYPECNFSKPYSVGVKCPDYGCDGDVVERMTKAGRLFYGCSNYPKCNFASWQRPENIVCPNCGNLFLVIKEDIGFSKIYHCPQCKFDFDDDLVKIENKKNLFA
ncbi:MAG: type I DNA topoisomerase [Calditrichaeota bacterium]|nr:type I DNA topoisomerase [Calditrichota bacterium]